MKFRYVYCKKHPNDGVFVDDRYPISDFECNSCYPRVADIHWIEFSSDEDINLRSDLSIMPVEAILAYAEGELENANYSNEIGLVRCLFSVFADGPNDKYAAMKLAIVFSDYLAGEL